MKLTKKIAVWVVVSVLSVVVSGCSTFRNNVGDNSLDYQNTKLLDPIQLPANAQTQAFTPLYQLPSSGQNTLMLENEKGKRFEMPAPISTVK
ncbi:hypothetical protein [Moraxella boevrei]|uniref:hypothetical protein n=1 Tax=Faucicola boevrei TaxID=346665 RepID=UPI0037358777